MPFMHSRLFIFLLVFFSLNFLSCGKDKSNHRVPTGTATIEGVVTYDDKIYGTNGFTGITQKAVRFAKIEIVDASNGAVLGTTTTDTSGAYTASFSFYGDTVYPRVIAEAIPPGPSNSIQVKNFSGALYSAASANIIVSPGGVYTGNINITLSTIADSLPAGPFNILDVLTNGFQFISYYEGTYPPAPLTGYWQPGDSRFISGTYFCSGYDPSDCFKGEGIYVLNESGGDTDEYDDDVLYHEFGHFTAAYFSQDESPGGFHRLTDSDLDMRLAWSEGWGDSMPGNIKMWLNAPGRQNLLSSASGVPLTEYIDTVGNTAGIAIDMGNPDGSYNHSYFYACGEVAVAKILLDSNKNFGMENVWAVLADFKVHSPLTPVNLELFWDRWHSLGKPTTSPPPSSVTIDSIFANRQIYYSADTFEPDETAATASTYTIGLTQNQTHTLYGKGDADFVSFDAIADMHYTITTANLLNGADTYIELFSSPNETTPFLSNDNSTGFNDWNSQVPSYYYPYLCDSSGTCHENKSDILGSSIGFNASFTGKYYVKITSSSKRPFSAGRYGSYTLTITSP